MKKIVITLLIISMVLSLGACTSDNNESGSDITPDEDGELQDVKISAGSGTAGGGQYVYVGGITNIVNRHVDGVEVILEATKGSGENVSLLQSGDLDIASIESSIAYNAMEGIDLDSGEEAFPKIRSMFASLPTHFIMATLDESVSNINEMEGKIVAFGPLTGSTDISSRAVFTELGLIDKFEVLNAGWGDCFVSLGEGQVDAVTGGSIHPAGGITELEASKDINFITFSDEQKKQLLDKFPYYKEVKIDKDVYNGFDEDYETIGAWQGMYASAESDDELIYQITKAVFENIDLLESTHPGGITTRLENLSEQPIPLHKGAYRYYEEMGIEVPDEFLPPEL